MLDRGESVRNHERGAVLHERGQRFLDRTFGLRVQRTGGLIENQDRSIFKQARAIAIRCL